MATVKLTDALRAEYVDLFTTCSVRPERTEATEKLVNSLEANRPRYEAVQSKTGVPWHFIAAIHNMESSQSFKGHLHNGDPLTARTKQIPPGRPLSGSPPFTWEVSAEDALGMHGVGTSTDWTLSGTLYQLERYNGFGYRTYHPQVKSPYLWSFSNHYTSGKYVADGTWSDTAKSAQCGAALLLRRMAERKLYSFPDQPLPAKSGQPLVVAYRTTKPKNPVDVAAATKLQQWLTTHDGIFVKADGIPGQKTSDAYKIVTGRYLPGDPRGK